MRIPPNDRMRLEEVAVCLDISISTITRYALREFLDKLYTDDGYLRYEVSEKVLKKGNR